MEFTTRGQAVKATKLSYIGGVSLSSKILKNEKLNVSTYIIYLASGKISGYNVCPKATQGCLNACLMMSGHNRIDIHENIINKARIKKTKMFFEDRAFFVSWVYAEILAHKTAAEKKDLKFSVRLNGTSDIAPQLFAIGDKTLFDLFPDTQFYDYTKVFNRVQLTKTYKNYDLTFSYSGENWDECVNALDMGVRVAMVFEKRLPKKYKGIEVVNADYTDLRYLDPKNVICGLIQKKVRTKIVIEDQNFIISDNDPNCEY